MASNRYNELEHPAMETAPPQPPSRRAFIAVAAGAWAGAALWALRRFPPPVVEASGGSGNPDSVTIVRFSDLGKPTGKVTVTPRHQVRCGVETTTLASLLPGNSTCRNRAPVYREHLEQSRTRHLSLRLLRQRSFQLRDQV